MNVKKDASVSVGTWLKKVGDQSTTNREKKVGEETKESEKERREGARPMRNQLRVS